MLQPEDREVRTENQNTRIGASVFVGPRQDIST